MQIFLSSYTHKTTFHMVLKNILPLIHPPLKNSIKIRLNNNSTCACHSFPFLKSQDIKKSFPQKRGNDLHMFLKNLTYLIRQQRLYTNLPSENQYRPCPQSLIGLCLHHIRSPRSLQRHWLSPRSTSDFLPWNQ